MVARFCTATEACDIDAAMATLAPDAELVSPVSGRAVFRGDADLRVLLGAVYGTVSNVRWRHILGNDGTHVALAEGTIAGVRLTDAVVLDLSGDGRIQRITPHLRPWLALTLLTLALGPRLVRHPGVIRRALNR
jgi:hypothetical protein